VSSLASDHDQLLARRRSIRHKYRTLIDAMQRNMKRVEQDAHLLHLYDCIYTLVGVAPTPPT